MHIAQVVAVLSPANAFRMQWDRATCTKPGLGKGLENDMLVRVVPFCMS